ncbi:hypothetical protein NBRC3293_3109 [Gluconobacter oxydans NBRC 3293]|uniref:Uncharacterized protein n=1 Tax=Gluconobacter oxydans NBRC 3293 TaxID=1315969 RepID=A0A829XDQ3_GLUOY|nr:hypothetical protein NBRC3293_2943 [Gluconobacter oxydans NBRC 3293]GEM18612.1 hypothetical protein NBRC3293_3109 [Gluconobacter oxydans NBRC 3293]
MKKIVVGVEPVELWAEPRLWSACRAVHHDARDRETAVPKSTGFTHVESQISTSFVRL